MQTVVIGEATAKGGARFDAVLPQGKVQNDFYRDIAVLAFPTPTDQTRTVGVDVKADNGSRMRSEGMKRYDIQPQPVEIPPGAVIPQNGVVDLTKQMAADGRLTWDAPAGNWTILRIGHTCTGQENSAAPQSGTGLECDKLSSEALDAFWAGGVQPVLDKLGPLAGKAFNNIHIDSYEKGRTNWTPLMREEFQKRRGYDPIPFLPTLTGRIIGSSAITERFLWDWRRTIADLFADNYYGHFADLCHQRGLTTSIEPYGGIGTPFESLQVVAKADLPMGEFWVRPGGIGGSVKVAANAAHTHGITHRRWRVIYGDLREWSLAGTSWRPQGLWRCGVDLGDQSHDSALLRASAVAGYDRARDDDGPVWQPFRPHQYLVGTVQALVHLHRSRSAVAAERQTYGRCAGLWR